MYILNLFEDHYFIRINLWFELRMLTFDSKSSDQNHCKFCPFQGSCQNNE